MNLSSHEVIINEELFVNTHRARILSVASKEVIRPYLARYEKYAFQKGKMICTTCYNLYERDSECGEEH